MTDADDQLAQRIERWRRHELGDTLVLVGVAIYFALNMAAGRADAEFLWFFGTLPLPLCIVTAVFLTTYGTQRISWGVAGIAAAIIFALMFLNAALLNGV